MKPLSTVGLSVSTKISLRFASGWGERALNACLNQTLMSDHAPIATVEPRLPPELEHKIFLLAANQNRANFSLPKVARRVQLWWARPPQAHSIVAYNPTIGRSQVCTRILPSIVIPSQWIPCWIASHRKSNDIANPSCSQSRYPTTTFSRS